MIIGPFSLQKLGLATTEPAALRNSSTTCPVFPLPRPSPAAEFKPYTVLLPHGWQRHWQWKKLVENVKKALGRLKASVILTPLVSKAMLAKCSKLTNARGKQSAEDTGSRKGAKRRFPQWENCDPNHSSVNFKFQMKRQKKHSDSNSNVSIAGKEWIQSPSFLLRKQESGRLRIIKVTPQRGVEIYLHTFKRTSQILCFGYCRYSHYIVIWSKICLWCQKIKL